MRLKGKIYSPVNNSLDILSHWNDLAYLNCSTLQISQIAHLFMIFAIFLRRSLARASPTYFISFYTTKHTSGWNACLRNAILQIYLLNLHAVIAPVNSFFWAKNQYLLNFKHGQFCYSFNRLYQFNSNLYSILCERLFWNISS